MNHNITISIQEIRICNAKWQPFLLGINALNHPTTHDTIHSRYIAVEYNTIFSTMGNEESYKLVHTMNSETHPIARPYGRAIGCLLWVLSRKDTAIYRESIPWIDVIRCRYFHLAHQRYTDRYCTAENNKNRVNIRVNIPPYIHTNNHFRPSGYGVYVRYILFTQIASFSRHWRSLSARAVHFQQGS